MTLDPSDAHTAENEAEGGVSLELTGLRGDSCPQKQHMKELAKNVFFYNIQETPKFQQ